MLCKNIIKKGRRKIEDIEKTKESLKEQSCEDIDIETAIDLMACIVFFDKEIFKENTIDSLFFSYGNHEMLAAYSSPEKTPGFPMGIYEVRVNSLFKDLTNWRIKIIFFEKDDISIREKTENYREATLEEKLVMIGVHEVRHRYQFINKPPLLSPYHIYYDSQINAYVKVMRVIMENDVEKFYKGYEQEKRPVEFDARAIERMALGEFGGKTTKLKICNIIKTEVDSIGYLK
jgi:hypothetical protein